MSEEHKSAEDQLRDATWMWAGRVAMAIALVGTGYFGGYMQMGDAEDLRMEVKKQRDRIVDLENQRETQSTRLAKERRDVEVCEKELKALEAGS